VLHTQDGSKKQPYYISFGEDSVMHMAALYDVWHTGEDNEVLGTFTILTTDSSQRLRWCVCCVVQLPHLMARVALPSTLQSWRRSTLPGFRHVLMVPSTMFAACTIGCRCCCRRQRRRMPGWVTRWISSEPDLGSVTFSMSSDVAVAYWNMCLIACCAPTGS
jgi:SOS response associated peptidase (SRAP)